MPDVGLYPATATARATASCSSGAARGLQHDPWRHQGLIVEDERTAQGGRARMATVLLTGRECPWRCAMCDLWTYTTEGDTPRGRDSRAGRRGAFGAARSDRARDRHEAV